MIKVGITGNIAAGKSVVEKMLSLKGYKVVDADVITHQILAEKPENLLNAFEGYDIFEGVDISRKKLGNLVFADKSLKKKLEEVIHPLVTERINKFFEMNKNEKFSFASASQLFETKMEKMFDKILFVAADDTVRLQRLMKRNNYTAEEAINRMSAQASQEEKIAKSDYIIRNNGGFAELETQLNLLF